jgi:apolipoprotein N-acyltransferase
MMKKILAVLLLALLLLGAAKSCGSDTKKPTPTTTTTMGIPKDSDGDFEYVPEKYRIIYYNITFYHAIIVGEETCIRWEETREPPSEREMVLLSFIKHFNITRERFDKANEEYLNSLIVAGDDLTAEHHEIPNVDLLYTFNNAKINDYYDRDPKKKAAVEEWLKTTKIYNSYEEYLKTNSK